MDMRVKPRFEKIHPSLRSTPASQRATLRVCDFGFEVVSKPELGKFVITEIMTKMRQAGATRQGPNGKVYATSVKESPFDERQVYSRSTLVEDIDASDCG